MTSRIMPLRRSPDHVAKDALSAEVFLRLAYSALVDADSLDTEAHKLASPPPERRSSLTLADLWSRYDTFLEKESPAPESTVNRVRREVYEACLEAASKPRGIFRLTVPTGGGKTRSAMAFALRHGIEHGLRRVIVAVPFTTITQQTAKVYRDIFGDERVVLEHHSAATENFGAASGDEDSFSENAVWQRLASENWDAPVVVTTTVQLFESLFSNRRRQNSQTPQPRCECDHSRRSPSAARGPALPYPRWPPPADQQLRHQCRALDGDTACVRAHQGVPRG